MLSPNEREILSGLPSFCFGEFYCVCQSNGCLLGEAGMRKRLQRLLKDGQIIRVGRNAYCIPQNGIRQYCHTYSDAATYIAKIMEDSFPLAEFAIFELAVKRVCISSFGPQCVVFVSRKCGSGVRIRDDEIELSGQSVADADIGNLSPILV